MEIILRAIKVSSQLIYVDVTTYEPKLTREKDIVVRHSNALHGIKSNLRLIIPRTNITATKLPTAKKL